MRLGPSAASIGVAAARFLLCVAATTAVVFPRPARAGQELWQAVQGARDVHRVSTLFTAQNLRDRLESEEGLARAVGWCRDTGVTKAYVESFRGNYRVPRELLVRVRDRLRAEGLEVSGCVTTTQVGKPSNGWDQISCYTDGPTQETLGEIFAYTAGLFDEIMIDDFWFTDCQCPECTGARQKRQVAIGNETFPVSGDSWADYRCELLLQLSKCRILEPARRVNPVVKVIIKYPQWYDRFQDRGYDVVRETELFDRTWVGTETRDYDDRRWGGTVQYEAYFLMRWLGGIGGAKCGGGWFDPYGTTERTYVEQARQTVLAGARESVLFCYGSLQEGTGPANVRALRAELPGLLDVAAQMQRRQPVGIAAYKPPGSEPGKEDRVFDFVGMLGLPLVPCHQFPADAKAVFLSEHALKDAGIAPNLEAFLQSGKPVLLTDGLARRLADRVDVGGPGVVILPVKGDPKRLLDLGAEEVSRIRGRLLEPFGLSFEAPNRVAFYPFEDGSWVVENFRDEPAAVEVGGEALSVEARGWSRRWK